MLANGSKWVGRFNYVSQCTQKNIAIQPFKISRPISFVYVYPDCIHKYAEKKAMTLYLLHICDKHKSKI